MKVMEPDDLDHLIRDKYQGDPSSVTQHDLDRLRAGEPLAYVIGWLPFLGLTIMLDSRPLIPRPETEWWTEQLIAHLACRFADAPFAFLDLCAGSGCIGLSVIRAFPNAHVSFAEVAGEHSRVIAQSLEVNGLDASQATIYVGDLYAALPTGASYDVIACNPPYIPTGRVLERSVAAYEPHCALYAGKDGLDLIQRIAADTQRFLREGGEVWLEADVSNVAAAAVEFEKAGMRTIIRADQYGRPRLVLAYT